MRGSTFLGVVVVCYGYALRGTSCLSSCVFLYVPSVSPYCRCWVCSVLRLRLFLCCFVSDKFGVQGNKPFWLKLSLSKHVLCAHSPLFLQPSSLRDGCWCCAPSSSVSSPTSRVPSPISPSFPSVFAPLLLFFPVFVSELRWFGRGRASPLELLLMVSGAYFTDVTVCGSTLWTWPRTWI